MNFDTLRGANRARIPEFKNNKGEPAHTRKDGSDWSPAQWLQAVVGELGEWAMARIDFEAGRITFEEYRRKSGKELADVVTYLDILARRSLDVVAPVYAHSLESVAQEMMKVVALLGELANARKKFDRGDYSDDEYLEIRDKIAPNLEFQTRRFNAESEDTVRFHPSDNVIAPHLLGVDLGAETRLKFNEVSERVGSSVLIIGDNWVQN